MPLAPTTLPAVMRMMISSQPSGTVMVPSTSTVVPSAISFCNGTVYLPPTFV